MLLMRSTLFLFMMVSVSSMIPHIIRKMWKRPTIISSPRSPRSEQLTEASIQRIILDSIDRSISPCKDFYRHSCGNRLSRDKMGLAQRTQKKLKEEIDSYVEQNPLTQAFVNSCMKQNDLKLTVTELILEKIKDIENSQNVSEIMSIVGLIGKETGVTAFFHDTRFALQLKDANLTSTLSFETFIPFHGPSKVLAMEILENDNILLYQELKIVRDAINQYSLSKVVPETFTDEHTDGNEDTSSSTNSSTLSRGSSNKNFIYLNEIVDRYSNTIGPMLKETFEGEKAIEEILISKNMNYKSLDSLQHFLMQAELSIVIMVVKYAIVNSVAFLYLENGYGVSPDKLQMVCQKRAIFYFQDMIFHTIDRPYRDPELIRHVKIMWLNILEEANLQLQDENSLLDETTKRDFSEKINSIQLRVEGENFDEELELQKIQKHFNNLQLEVENNSFYDNLLKVHRIHLKMNINKIGKNRNFSQLRELLGGSIVYLDNRFVVIFSSFLRFPMTTLNKPSVFHYAITGNMLAHLLTRRISPVTLYSKNFETPSNYLLFRLQWEGCMHTQAVCFDNVYSNLHFNPKNIHFLDSLQGLHTLDSYITNSGLELAYNAFMKKGDTSEYLGYSPEKLFFLSYAQRYCSSKPSNLDIEATINSFVFPPEIRVNGNLMQNNDFAKAFNCSANSRMNSQTKCNWWGKPESPSKL